MSRLTATFACVLLLPLSAPAFDHPHGLVLSSYLGGRATDQVRDVATDSAGNVYVAGGTESADFPVRNAHDATFNGWSDAFVLKLSARGELLWSTFLGGPAYDRAYALDVDAAGNVFVAGRAGAGFPVTPGAFQTEFLSGTSGLYGEQDGFVAKLSPTGRLLFASYLGDNSPGAIRDVVVDALGQAHVALAVHHAERGGMAMRLPPALASALTRGARPLPLGGRDDNVVAKISANGARLLAATWVGGSGDEGGGMSLAVTRGGEPLLLTSTTSWDAPTTPFAWRRTPRGGSDLYLARLSADYRSFVAATYLGGSADDATETHHLALRSDGGVVLAATTLSVDFPTTRGAFERRHRGNGGPSTGGNTNHAGDGVVCRLDSSLTTLVASTFLGGREGDGVEGVAVDEEGVVLVSGATYSPDFPTTTSARQPALHGPRDAFLVAFHPTLGSLRYASYLGGADADAGRALAVDPSHRIWIGGITSSRDFEVRRPLQPTPATSISGFLASFAPEFTRYGWGVGGTGGQVPRLGIERDASSVYASLTQARPGAPFAVVFGLEPAAFPLAGGTLLVIPTGTVVQWTSATGSALVTWPLPAISARTFTGTLYFQGLVLDPGAPFGIGVSRGAAFTFVAP